MALDLSDECHTAQAPLAFNNKQNSQTVEKGNTQTSVCPLSTAEDAHLSLPSLLLHFSCVATSRVTPSFDSYSWSESLEIPSLYLLSLN